MTTTTSKTTDTETKPRRTHRSKRRRRTTTKKATTENMTTVSPTLPAQPWTQKLHDGTVVTRGDPSSEGFGQEPEQAPQNRKLYAYAGGPELTPEMLIVDPLARPVATPVKRRRARSR